MSDDSTSSPSSENTSNTSTRGNYGSTIRSQSNVGTHNSSSRQSSSPALHVSPRRRPTTRRLRRPRSSAHYDNSTTSASSRLSVVSQWSTMTRQRWRQSALFLFRNKRKTFPPASTVLEDEKRRFTHSQKRGKLKQRHSLAGILQNLTQQPQAAHSNKPSVRSSMLLHMFEDDDSPPEILYYDDDRSRSSTLSSRQCMLDPPPPPPPLPPAVASAAGMRRSDGLWFYSWVEQHNQKNKHKAIPIYHPPPTISSLSSQSKRELTVTQPYRFSAFWQNALGHGKHEIEVTNGRPSLASAQPAHPCATHASLFLFGFLFCPLWWVGAWMHLRRRAPRHELLPQASVAFATPRLLGQLNCWMSAFSFLVVPVIVGLAIWYDRSYT